MNIKELEEKFHQIVEENKERELDELEERIYKLEEELSEELEFCFPGKEKPLLKLIKKISLFKKENDFYDAESELNRMFPNRNDDDFDDDSMSYESVFGKD